MLFRSPRSSSKKSFPGMTCLKRWGRTMVSKKDLEEMNQKLWKELDGRNGCSAAVGCSFLDNPDDLGVLLDEADKRMYRNKQQYYKSRSDS